MSGDNPLRLPAVDAVLKAPVARALVDMHGRHATTSAIREILAVARAANDASLDLQGVAIRAQARLEAVAAPRLKPVFNLTGTVLHTNLGRAVIAAPAIEAAVATMRAPVNLEYDIAAGRRGERDDILRDLLRELTGAEDATIVNNNAAAVLITLNTLAKGRGAIVSRGELIEIGGAFRMPDVMRSAGARLVEVGTTNRTHARDYADAIDAKTGLILKVHTSNYRIEGFTAGVPARELAQLAHKHGIPLVNDLGSGTLLNLERLGLVHEPTVAEALIDGCDLVTFSGDKLLGGPQAGFIVGRAELVARINKNPMKRALRVDKIRLAAIEATLKLYRDPDRLAERLPTMRFLARGKAEVATQAQRLATPLIACLGDGFVVEAIDCASQVGSGAMPLSTLASAGLAIRPREKRASGRVLAALATALRRLPIPVIARIEAQALILDLRCLDDEAGFIDNLAAFDLKPK